MSITHLQITLRLWLNKEIYCDTTIELFSKQCVCVKLGTVSTLQPPPGAQLFAKVPAAPSRPPKPSLFPPAPSPPLPRPRGPDDPQFNGRPAAPRYPPPPPLHTPKEKDPYQMVAIKADSVTLGGELGQGEFGSVLRGKYKQPNGKMVSMVQSFIAMLYHFSLRFFR